MVSTEHLQIGKMSIKEQLRWLPTTYAPVISSYWNIQHDHHRMKYRDEGVHQARRILAGFKSNPEHASGAANTFLILLTKA